MKKLKLVINNQIKENKHKFFFKKELQTIMNLYGEMVSNGDCKDYGFTVGKLLISFDIYQRQSEKPILKIQKNLKPSSLNQKFLLKDSNENIIDKSENINILLKKIKFTNLKLIK